MSNELTDNGEPTEAGPRFLADLTWRDIEEHGSSLTLLVPVGSTEQHGPHLPLDTDTRIAKALCIAASGHVQHAIVAPEITYGASGEHQDFPGTISIGTEALTTMLVELARSALGPFASLIFVNGHGGNGQAVTAATTTAVAEGRTVLAFWPRFVDDDPADGRGGVPVGDVHAGFIETSIMLALAPYAVSVDDAEPGVVEPFAELLPRLRADGVRRHAPNGVLGDPMGASADVGWTMIERAVADLVTTLDKLQTGSAEPMEA